MKDRTSKEELCKYLTQTPHPQSDIYMIGRSTYGRKVLDALLPSVQIRGIIDEFTKDDYIFDIPVVHSLIDLPTDCIVINATVSNHVHTINKKLDTAKIRHIDYFSLMHYCPELHLSIDYWEGFRESYTQRRDEYDTLHTLLADETSKDTLQRIIKFRMEYDICQMDIFTEKQDKQYFEPFLNLASNSSLIDVGGYDGYTTMEFIKKCPDYGHVWFFEPSEDNLAIAQKTLKGHNRIFYFPLAASDKEEELHFEYGDSASKVTEDGSLVVKADRIDNIIAKDCPKLFIKMDIEGAESLAIAGAAETIKACHPTMAICVYHKGSDLIDIPKQILSIRNDYKLYLRHYTEGITETVMFFVPTVNG